MQDEQMDNMDDLIREASNSHHPAYDDKSWEKMEELLDKHLPVKKDRINPFIFFLTLLFIMGAGLLTFLYLPSHKKDGTTAAIVAADIPVQKAPATVEAVNIPMADVSKIPAPQSAGFPGDNSKKLGSQNFKKPLTNNRAADIINNGSTNSSNISNQLIAGKNITIKNDQLLAEKMQFKDGNKNLIPASFGSKVNEQPAKADTKNLQKDNGHINAKGAVKMDVPKVTVADTAFKSSAEPIIKKGFSNNFVINVSVGSDLSFVGLNNTSKAKLNYGAGLSYTFAGRFTVRSGFYIAKKTYSAMSTDYHPPASYWTNNSDLKSIYADCNIYEIPLNASYNFKPSGSHHWFAGIGFSTFLMKRETYHYFYKDSWGQAMNRSWTLLNGGNQYFSVLTISGGYQYDISPSFSILAEPYLKLPLQGIGFGKIKLNSGGLLFTASIKPFAKRK